MADTEIEPMEAPRKPRRRKRVRQQVLVEQAWRALHGERLTAYVVAARLYREVQTVTAVERLLQDRYNSGYVCKKTVSDWINRGNAATKGKLLLSLVEGESWQTSRRSGNTEKQRIVERLYREEHGDHLPYFHITLGVYREVDTVLRVIRTLKRRYGVTLTRRTAADWIRSGLIADGAEEEAVALRGAINLQPAKHTGAELKALRQSLGILQQDVARVMQAGVAHVARVENGQKTTLEFEKRYKRALRRIEKMKRIALEEEAEEE